MADPERTPKSSLTISELAEKLRVGRPEIRKWIRSGEFRAVDLGDPGRPRLLITPDRLEAFLKGRECPSQPKPARRRRPRQQKDYYPD
jgi:excisionase family DNA binding protein